MDSSTIIQVENVSKLYRLEAIGSSTVSDDVSRLWKRVLGKKQVFEKEINEPTQSDYLWALKDVNFDVSKGEVLGIIGKNGSGKSTLLKIISQITSPTTGTIKIKGRIASLLEVGTGFHPQLSGRENIFLNGAILGMTKREIKNKFDEIVDFSGVEKFIDTPVKRYSSGMYVRLAFAVAAHLEPEILILDEVLAVGDAEFQKKCLGKMKNVAGEGRTVLFVSHSMNAVATLCSRAIFLQNGKVVNSGEVLSVINAYMAGGNRSLTSRYWDEATAPGDDVAKLLSVCLINEHQVPADCFLLGGKKYGIKFTYKVISPINKPVPQVHLYSNRQENIFISYGYYDQSEYYNSQHVLSPGLYESIVWFDTPIFNTMLYQVGVGMANIERTKLHFWEEDAIAFETIENAVHRKTLYKGSIGGIVRPELEWENIKLK